MAREGELGEETAATMSLCDTRAHQASWSPVVHSMEGTKVFMNIGMQLGMETEMGGRE